MKKGVSNVASNISAGVRPLCHTRKCQFVSVNTTVLRSKLKLFVVFFVNLNHKRSFQSLNTQEKLKEK